MPTLRSSFRCLRDLRPSSNAARWPAPTTTTLAFRTKQSSQCTRSIATTARRAANLENNEMVSKSSSAWGALSAAASADQDTTSSSSSDGGVKFALARPVPVSPSYFSKLPLFNDSYVVIQDLARKYGRLPTIAKDAVAPTAWKTKEQYRLSAGEHVKGRDYAECMKLAKSLNRIHPDIVPEDVTAGLAPFKRDINYYLNRPKVAPVDRFGRSHGVGKRKSSMARAWVVEGTGEVLINGKPLSDAFGRIHDRESAVWGLKLTERMDKYNVWALVEGGGTTGQAEALALAIAKALIVHEPALKNPLRRAGCITRDPRTVERKKAGHVKARKMPTWVKR